MLELMDASDSTIKSDAIEIFNKYGNRHRTFGHGADHGLLFSIFMALRIIEGNALFERRSFKYIFLHWGYWLLISVLVGGLLCATLIMPSV